MAPKDLQRCMLWATEATEQEIKEFIKLYGWWKTDHRLNEQFTKIKFLTIIYSMQKNKHVLKRKNG